MQFLPRLLGLAIPALVVGGLLSGCTLEPSPAGASADAAAPAAFDAPPPAENRGDAGAIVTPFDAEAADAARPETDTGPADAADACLRTVPVATTSALAAAVASARAGDCIRLADGDYVFPNIAAKGTGPNPIVIAAEHLGMARVSTKSLALDGAAYVVVEGLLYTSNEGVRLTNCDHCRLTRNTFHITETGPTSWVQVEGSTGGHNRIDHNELGPKTHEGNLIGLYGAGATILPFTQIDHNYFHDVGPVTSNGWETIRAGLSGLSHSSGHVTIEYNLFESCEGDPEIISTKSCDNTIRYNTLRSSRGQICLRIGSRTSVYGNFILGGGVAQTGGIRVLGQDHEIFDNYIEAVDGDGIFLEGGESEETPSAGAFHYRVYRAKLVFNTIVGAKTGIRIGGAHPLSPVDSIVANNLIQASSGAMFGEALQPVNTLYLGNIVDPAGSAVVGIAAQPSEARKADPKLVTVGEIRRLAATSPAIDAAIGSFAFVTEDIDGDPRTKPDVGADEYSAAPPVRRPLVRADVGPNSP